MDLEDRPKIRKSDWWALSAELSPEMMAGFDLESLDPPTPELRALLGPPKKEFRVHTLQSMVDLAELATGLCVYGEMDRAVAGLRVLERVPVEEFKVPEYTFLHRILCTGFFFVSRARRADLVEVLQELYKRGARGPLQHTLEGDICDRYLDWDDDERASFMAEKKRGTTWASYYLDDIANFALIWAYGGSEKLPPTECEREIGRYVQAIFELPGYAPWTGAEYPYTNGTSA